MKVGCQTIIFGDRPARIESVLDVIAALGYQGVEFSQPPEVLGDIQSLLKMLRARNLTLVGLAGGSLEERMHYCGLFRPDYLYTEDWDAEVAPGAIEKGFTLALHPHLYKAVHRLSDAIELLQANPGLKFLPDTAHLTIPGDDPVKAIQEGRDRLAGVHLKDWTPEYGRSSHRYARGFVELGKGVVRLGAVLKELTSTSYPGWLIVEQDRPRSDLLTSMIESAGWLAERNLLPKPPRLEKLASLYPTVEEYVVRKGEDQAQAEIRFLRDMMQATGEEMSSCYDTIAKAFTRLVRCDLVTVWACSPAEDLMSLLAVRPDPKVRVKSPLKAKEVLSNTTINRQRVTHFHFTNDETRKRSGDPDLLQARSLKRMISIPVLNPWNPNHVRLLVNIFPSDDEVPFSDDDLFDFGHYVALAADSALDSLCYTAAAKANLLAGKRDRDAKGFLQSVVDLIRHLLNCEGVAVFLVNETRDRLELFATTGTDWTVPPDEQFYREGEGLTGKVWKRNEPFLTCNALREQGWRGKSTERVEHPEKHDSLTSPIVKPTGEIVGVVRCRNKREIRQMTSPNAFSDDDSAVLDAISQAVVSHLDVLLSQEQRAKAWGKLTHELKTPVVAIRGAAQFMLRTDGVKDFFGEDYPEDIWSLSELMRRLLDNAAFLRYAAEGMKLEPKLCYLMADVIAPAVKQVKSLLREKGLPRDGIQYGEFKQIPRIWIDKNQFQQVVFNLLSNAIKYYRRPDPFKVEIDGARYSDGFLLWFRDWGPGIRDGLEDFIFQEGFRGPGASDEYVAGQGLGLWIVRQVIESHGGQIKVTNNHSPTEFTIYLPQSLAFNSPPTDLSGRRQK